VTGGAAAMKRKATETVNVSRVIAGRSYHFVIAVVESKRRDYEIHVA
jgi:hypothetical protein